MVPFARALGWLALVLGIVLSPLRAMAAVPMIFAYDAAVRPTATTALGSVDAVRPERGERPEYAYDAVLVGYDGAANPQVVARAGAIRAYGPALNFPNRREVGEGVIYDALTATTAAEGASTLFTAADVGPLPAAIANTFRGGSYTATTLSEATTLYRVYGGTAGQLGSYWTRIAPAGPLQATMDLARIIHDGDGDGACSARSRSMRTGEFKRRHGGSSGCNTQRRDHRCRRQSVCPRLRLDSTPAGAST